jgi:ABC-type sugar transport system permease subunit
MSRAIVTNRNEANEAAERVLPLVFAYPSTLLILVLIIIPIGFEVALSFSQRNAYTGEQHFIGVTNYSRVLQDQAFWGALWRSTLYAFTTTTLQLFLGVLMAFYTFNQTRRTRIWLRAVCFLPYVISIVAAVIVFEFLFDSQYGIVTKSLSSLGFDSDWYSGPKLFLLLVVISVWQFTPFVFLIVLARLETIPTGILEAAEVDGARPSQMVLRVILPQLRETLIAAALLRLIFMFTKFDTPWLLAGSRGTNRYVETLPVYSFRQAFEMLQLGDAAASGMLLFIGGAIVVALVIWLTRQRSETA